MGDSVRMLYKKTQLIFSSKRWFSVMAVLVYVFFTIFYMGPTLWNCSDTVAGIGDSTGGPIWRASLEPAQPLVGGPQQQTNFPFGEDLYSPVGYAIIAQTILFRGLDVAVGPVCSYNVINGIGYLTTSLMMFAFLLYLIKNKWIALLGGYAVAFTPYIQSKIGGHPSYGYASLLIGIFWLTLHIIKSHKYRYGFGLAIVLALCAYFDPYFILLAITVLLPTLIAWLALVVLERHKAGEFHQSVGKSLKVFILSFFFFIILVSPLAYIRLNDAAAINASTGPTRGNLVAIATMCSNLLPDYLLPDPYNMHLMSWFGQAYIKANIGLRNWCGPGESRVAISLTMMGLIFIGILTYVIRWKRMALSANQELPKMGYGRKIVFSSVVLVMVSAFLLGLPPEIRGVITPSGLVIKITETWRIFAREYLVLNTFTVILFAISLTYIAELIRGRWRRLLPVFIGVIWIVIIAEYQIYSPFDPFNFKYSRDVPTLYRDIQTNNDINALAEYPIDRMGVESDVIVYYATMQYVHKKPILNSALINNPNEKLHVSIKDLSDPQTLPILRALGINYITIHGVGISEIEKYGNQLEVIKVENPEVYGIQLLKSAKNNTIILARIRPGVSLGSALVVNKGYAVNTNIMKSPIDIEYEIIEGSELAVIPVMPGDLPPTSNVCFDIRTAGAPIGSKLTISINGKPFTTYDVSEQYRPVSLVIDSKAVVTLSNTGGYNMRLNNLGCPTKG